MIPKTEQLLSEFVDDWNAGRRPDVADYLRRVPEGADRDTLAAGIDLWLSLAPTPTYTDAQRDDIRTNPILQRVMAAVGEDTGLWPQLLPELRTRSKLSLGELAARVVERFSLGAGAEARTEDYLGRMERGDLEPTRVSRRLLDGLADLLGVSGDVLADAGGFGRGLRPAAAGGTLFRSDGADDLRLAADLELLTAAAMEPAPARLDEVDRLFVGGPEG